MAKRQVVSYSYTCDVCGSPIPESDGEGAARKLSWEGTDYAVDVCATHGSQLGAVLTQLKGFVESGQRESGAARRGRRPAVTATGASTRAPRAGRAATSVSTSGPAPKSGDVAAIRAWARENGYTVNERGRIPAPVMAAYDASTCAPASAPEDKPAAARKGRPRKAAS